MQYHIQTLVKHLFDKDSFEQVTVQELKQFTDDYPYAAVGQFLYAKKLKDSGSYDNYEQCQQASLYFHNSLWLRWQLDQKEEAPAMPRTEEPMQQPGFRIVVQMPKTGQANYTAPPAEEENQEGSAIQASATGVPEETPVTEQPAAEQPAAAAAEMPEAEGISLQVNEDGSLVEQVAPEEEQAAEIGSLEQTEEATLETASAVAIAESSQLAEENTAGPAGHAVSISEEALSASATTKENTEIDDIVPAIEATPLEVEKAREQDEIVPAVEATPLEVEQARTEDEIVPAVEATPLDIEKAREQDEVVPAVEIAPEEIAAVTDSTTVATPAEETAVNAEMPPAEIAIGEAAATGIDLEEQPVTAVTENSKEESAAITAAAEQPAVAASAAPVQPQPYSLTPGKLEGQTAVDPGEPIFESYHTIDYFASQGVKLMQDDLKDRLGKKMKSFTDWLRSMKRIGGPIETNTSLDEVTNQSIQRIAEHSVEEKEVLTEAMAEVWAKQGNAAKAIRVYEKLSLLNPAKSPYFAGRIEQLKAQ
ncbi:hypothetical protein [Longitalea luteola]|uniref:hypothetical protein n=1 Tax=Longitalea luteola TaxID=2812563 RepID=UPI001A964FED|nr:hypothetical protein [Longitalea luteola]